MSKPAPAVAVAAAFGAATVTALAQLGLASGLAIVIWREATPEAWAAHLTWAAWLSAASTVIGGSIGARLTHGVTGRVVALLAAGVGAFVTAPLVAIPAMRFAESGISAAPFAAAGIGVLAGIALTAAGMVSRAIAMNVSASIVLAWLLAGMATFFPVGGLDEQIRLGIWGTWQDLSGETTNDAVSLAPPLLIGALLIGAITAWLAGGGNANTRAVGLSGAAGPLLIVVGYIAAGQPEVGVEPQWNGIWLGLYATIAGLLGSLLVTALRKQPTPAPESAPVPPPTTEPTYLSIDRDDAWAGGEADHQPPTQYKPSDASPTYTRHDDPDVTDDLNQPLTSPSPDPEPVTEPVKRPKPKKSKEKKARKREDAPSTPETEPTAADESESWVSGLKDPDNPDPYGFDELDEPRPDPEPEPESKKRRFGRKKAE